MQRFELALSPEEASGEQSIRKAVSSRYGSKFQFRILKRSIDARSRNVKIRLLIEVFSDASEKEVFQKRKWQNVSNAEPVLIAGCGPAGLFAAIRLIESGFKPVIIERGKDVRNRRRDLAAINKQGKVNPESNYCFGEGGAGTYSDGKLYTRSNKRGDIQAMLHTFIEFGASADIAIDAHPHIGTNKLPGIISSMRQMILNCGGEILFNTKLVDIHSSDGKFKSITVRSVNDVETTIHSRALILATGHSARDIFYLLQHKGIAIEGKPFALGVRAEHDQRVIDAAQYHQPVRSPYLPPASYSLRHQYNNRGIYSFCMCPGGIIAPAATGIDEVVVNGWSPSKRNNPFANSGIVVSVTDDDVKAYASFGELRFLKFQEEVEKNAFKAGGGNLQAPAQRIADFVAGKTSSSLPACSYIPGVTSVNLHDVVPSFIAQGLREAFVHFGRKIKGYHTNDAIITGVESRTSSPVRIPRNNDNAMHVQTEGLFPCGEGAGYAGGIISAAIDGDFVASKCALFLTNDLK